MKLKPWLFTALLAVSSLSLADEPVTLQDRYVGLGMGMSNVSFLSPITYSNLSLRIGNNISKIYPTKDMFYSSKYTLGLNANINQNLMINYGYNLILGQNHNFEFDEFDKGYFKLGYSFWNNDELFLKPDNVNNILYLNISNMIAANLGFVFKVKRARFENKLIFPVMGLYYGSKYNQNLPGIVEDSSFKDGFKFGSFNVNSQFYNNFSCDLPIKLSANKFQTLRLSYGIDYVKLKLHNNIKHVAIHEITISTLINLKYFVYE